MQQRGNTAAHLDVGDSQSRVQDTKCQEGAEVLAHKDGVEAHDGDAGCTDAMPKQAQLTQARCPKQKDMKILLVPPWRGEK